MAAGLFPYISDSSFIKSVPFLRKKSGIKRSSPITNTRTKANTPRRYRVKGLQRLYKIIKPLIAIQIEITGNIFFSTYYETSATSRPQTIKA